MESEQGRKWNDMILSGQGGQAAIDIITELRQGRDRPGDHAGAGNGAYQIGLAADHQGGRGGQ